MPSAFKRSERPSRYQPIADFLAASDDDEVVLTFKQIAAIIGLRTLPETAILHPTWWRDKLSTHVVLWRAIGWQARADRDHLRVTFTRATEE